ncbi:hypothetical protein G6O69_24250 [Pseudenhygromyxa sp. WMMC2535]|uniref:hypothetical protein n=1 Tax=Pseudenhygromyxa sp. WMMC2535 TaxID=2712867 RepID=UPI0015564243|nr:hypothetical protein [Pseudenhygromyxa sp. WMMC2535]NVB40974.1 hypothetical protein [Pseudenhygromyxa sp. WMMC2535]
MPDTRTHHDDELLRLSSTGALLFVRIRQRFTHREALALYSAQEYLRATVGRHALVMLVGETDIELSERTRTMITRTAAEFSSWITCIAHVVEVRGFKGAAIRCMMAGMRSARRPPYPVREFSTTRAAAMWMAPLLTKEALPLPFAASPEALQEWISCVRDPGCPAEDAPAPRRFAASRPIGGAEG